MDLAVLASLIAHAGMVVGMHFAASPFSPSPDMSARVDVGENTVTVNIDMSFFDPPLVPPPVAPEAITLGAPAPEPSAPRRAEPVVTTRELALLPAPRAEHRPTPAPIPPDLAGPSRGRSAPAQTARILPDPPKLPPLALGPRPTPLAPSPATAARAARLTHNPKPRYPPSCLRRRQQGTVVLAVQVLANGCVGQVRVDKSSGVGKLDQAAARAVRTWRFTPATEAGRPITSWVTQPVRFAISG
jgi:protein TonB